MNDDITQSIEYMIFHHFAGISPDAVEAIMQCASRGQTDAAILLLLTQIDIDPMLRPLGKTAARCLRDADWSRIGAKCSEMLRDRAVAA